MLVYICHVSGIFEGRSGVYLEGDNVIEF